MRGAARHHRASAPNVPKPRRDRPVHARAAPAVRSREGPSRSGGATRCAPDDRVKTSEILANRRRTHRCARAAHSTRWAASSAPYRARRTTPERSGNSAARRACRRRRPRPRRAPRPRGRAEKFFWASADFLGPQSPDRAVRTRSSAPWAPSPTAVQWSNRGVRAPDSGLQRTPPGQPTRPRRRAKRPVDHLEHDQPANVSSPRPHARRRPP
jgi:hypothetical protein